MSTCRVASGQTVTGLSPLGHVTTNDGRVLQTLSLEQTRGQFIPPSMAGGEKVLVSGEDGTKWALSTGYIRSMTEATITVLIDRLGRKQPLENHLF